MRAGVDTLRLEQKKDSHTETEKRSSLFRRLMWFMRVKVLDTGSLYRLLWMENQLLKHPVVAGLFNGCFPRSPISQDLSGQSALRRWQDRSRIPQLRWLLHTYTGFIKAIERWQEEDFRGGIRRVLHREHLHGVSVFIYKDLILSFELEKMRFGPRIWVVYHLIWETEILFIRE